MAKAKAPIKTPLKQPKKVELLDSVAGYLSENPGSVIDIADYEEEIKAGLIVIVKSDDGDYHAYLPGDEPGDEETEESEDEESEESEESEELEETVETDETAEIVESIKRGRVRTDENIKCVNYLTTLKPKIEDNIAIPNPGQLQRVGSSKYENYPFDLLKIGQSFFVPSNGNIKELKKTIMILVHRFNFENKEIVPGKIKIFRGKEIPVRRSTKYFVARVADDNSGIRIWRTELPAE
jgi:hypothetical protein